MSGSPAYLLLEDGTRFDGESVGAPAVGTGEVVFNTAMSGYQEAVTDPSYAGQIIVFTYPLIGNYGVAESQMESDRIHARAVIMREGMDREDAAHAEGGWLTWLSDCGIPALSGVDTRALVRHIRDKGAMRGGIFGADVAEAEARERVMAEPSMTGADLAREVTPAEPVILEGDGPRVIAIDTGIKNSIVRNLRDRGVHLELHPCTVTAEELLAREPDAVFLANGPGDPGGAGLRRGRGARRGGEDAGVGHLPRAPAPVQGRGARHLQAAVRPPRREPPGEGPRDRSHRDHLPEPRLRRARARTARGRSRADEPVRWDTDFGVAELQQLNLYDRTVEGLVLRDVQGSTVQYHPEAGPGPHDALHLFDRFLERLVAA